MVDGFESDKDWIWTCERNGELTGGYADTKEEAEGNKQKDDKMFTVSKNVSVPLGEQEEEYEDKYITTEFLKTLHELGVEDKSGNDFLYQKIFLCGITRRKDWLLQGIRYLPNSFLHWKPFRYMYAIYEMAYLKDRVFLRKQQFKQRLLETKKVPEKWKNSVNTVFETAHHFKKNITEDEFKDSIQELTKEAKLRNFDKEIAKAIKHREKRAMVPAEKILRDYLTSFEDIKDRGRPVEMSKLSKFALEEYGDYNEYNYNLFSSNMQLYTGGGYRGETWIVGGYTSDGKTQYAKELIWDPVKQGDVVLFVTLEMLEEEMRMIFETRMAYDMGFHDITLNKIRRRKLGDEEYEQYKEIIEEFASYKNLMILQPRGKFTMDDLEMEIDKIQAERKLDIVVVDYLELIDPERRYESYRVRVKEVMRRAKKLSTQKDIWMVIPHQISRHGRKEAENRKPEPYYVMQDLQESSGVEQNSAVITWIYQDDFYREKERAKIGIAKNRMGATRLEGWEIGTDWKHARVYEDGMKKTSRYEVDSNDRDPI